MSKLIGFWRLSGATEILDFDTFETLQSFEGEYHESYVCTLKMASRTPVRVSYELRHGREH
jgi:hypothetical protein